MNQPSEKQGDNLTLLPSVTRINLHDGHSIRRELASVYRDMRSGKVETSDGTKLAYVLNMLMSAYQTTVLQEKIETIENTINIREKNKREESKRAKSIR